MVHIACIMWRIPTLHQTIPVPVLKRPSYLAILVLRGAERMRHTLNGVHKGASKVVGGVALCIMGSGKEGLSSDNDTESNRMA